MGGAGNDRLDGGTGRDLLFGEDGDDELFSDSFHNRMDGGDGSDTANYSGFLTGMDINLFGGFAAVTSLGERYPAPGEPKSGEGAGREGTTKTPQRFPTHLWVGLAPDSGLDNATGVRLPGREAVPASRSLYGVWFVSRLLLLLHSQLVG